MLVPTRKEGEVLVIGGYIHITVVSIQDERVRLGFAAPPTIQVDRQEIYTRRLVNPDGPNRAEHA